VGAALAVVVRSVWRPRVKENSLFYYSQVSWCSTRAHTHLHLSTCLDTPVRFTWITFSCLSLITHCQNSKSGCYCLTSGSKLIGQNVPCHKCKLLCWPADIHSVTWFPHPSSSRRLPAARVAKWRAQGKNLQSEQNGHWLANANLYK
jgi:hypothetical protein